MNTEKIFDFKLTPAYCVFKKIAVFEQRGPKIIFMVEDLQNFALRRKIEKVFSEYIFEICGENKRLDIFKKNIKIDFIKCTNEELRRVVLKSRENENRRENHYKTAIIIEENCIDGAFFDENPKIQNEKIKSQKESFFHCENYSEISNGTSEILRKKAKNFRKNSGKKKFKKI